MGQRVRLAKNLAAGSSSVSIRIRTAIPPWRLVATGGFTGNVTVQHSVDSMDTADGSATWITLSTLANGGEASVSDPVYRVRVNGGHSAGSATVDLLEDVCHKGPY